MDYIQFLSGLLETKAPATKRKKAQSKLFIYKTLPKGERMNFCSFWSLTSVLLESKQLDEVFITGQTSNTIGYSVTWAWREGYTPTHSNENEFCSKFSENNLRSGNKKIVAPIWAPLWMSQQEIETRDDVALGNKAKSGGKFKKCQSFVTNYEATDRSNINLPLQNDGFIQNNYNINDFVTDSNILPSIPLSDIYQYPAVPNELHDQPYNNVDAGHALDTNINFSMMQYPLPPPPIIFDQSDYHNTPSNGEIFTQTFPDATDNNLNVKARLSSYIQTRIKTKLSVL